MCSCTPSLTYVWVWGSLARRGCGSCSCAPSPIYLWVWGLLARCGGGLYSCAPSLMIGLLDIDVAERKIGDTHGIDFPGFGPTPTSIGLMSFVWHRVSTSPYLHLALHPASTASTNRPGQVQDTGWITVIRLWPIVVCAAPPARPPRALSDGFSIACDVCSRWSRSACFGIAHGKPAPKSFLS